MAASPQVMQALSQGGGGAPPPAPGPAVTAGLGGKPLPGPNATPMLTPQKAEGTEQGAKVDLMIAQKMIIKAMANLPQEMTLKLTKVVAGIAELIGKEDDDTERLLPAERSQLLGDQAGPGAAPKGTPPPAPPTAPPPPQM